MGNFVIIIIIIFFINQSIVLLDGLDTNDNPSPQSLKVVQDNYSNDPHPPPTLPLPMKSDIILNS